MNNLRDIITVAVVNFKVETGNKDKNLQRIVGFSKAAARRGADLILFPEMALTGYDYYVDKTISTEEKRNMAESISGPSFKALDETARENAIYIVVGMPEKDDDTLYNSAYVTGPEGGIGTYRKIHPFSTESIWCAKGEDPFMFDTEWGPISVGICFDTYQFPELMRHYASKGSRLYLNPTAVMEELQYGGSRKGFLNYYGPTLEYGVICNSIYVASANLTGVDKDHFFAGGSCIIGPKLTPYFDTDYFYYGGNKDNVQEEIFISTIDLSLATRPLFEKNEITDKPDYRPEIYKKFL